MKVVTRFAPSPTGYLHVGGVRTALFAWLLARQTDGKLILRIEDTDKTREVEGSEAHIVECLKWLGILWDVGPGKSKDPAEYKQSYRLQIYHEWAVKLIESGRAYADPTTPDQLQQMRAEAKAKKQPFLFRNYRPSNTPEWDGKTPLRFKSEPKPRKWQDAVMGKLSAGPEATDDFILVKSDGYPTYNFAHIVDDHLMGVTHVMRSQEFLPSVPKFLDLYEALGIEPPVIATLPFVMGPDGRKKLSKRDGAKDILDYRQDGFLPEALVSFMATLGWNDGTEQEVFSREELIEKFSLDRVQRSGASFDERRLVWTNGHFIREMPTEDLYKRIGSSYWGVGAKATKEEKLAVLALVKERLKFFSELAELTSFFFSEPSDAKVLNLYTNPLDKQLKKMNKSEISVILRSVFEQLDKTNFDHDSLQSCLNDMLQRLDLKPAVLFPIIRIAVSGSAVSPEIFGTLEVLGKEKSLARIRKALSQLDS